MATTIIALISALLLMGGFVWWRIEKNLGSQQVVSGQSDEIERSHAKIAAEQAERVAKAKADQEVMYADAQRIAEISDAEERRKAALEAVKRAIERRKAADIYPPGS